MALPKTIQKVVEALLGSAGKTDPALRHAIFERTRKGTGEIPLQGPGAVGVRELVQKIDDRPWTVSDEDFLMLRRAGYCEDKLFEITVAAATGAGVRRLEAGFRALEASAPEQEELHYFIPGEVRVRVVAPDEKHGGGR